MKTWEIFFFERIPFPFLLSQNSNMGKNNPHTKIILWGKATDLPYPLFVESQTSDVFLFVENYDDFLTKWDQTFYAK